MWLVIDVIGVAILGLAIAYGLMSWRKRRSSHAVRAGEQATERLYQEKDPGETRHRGAG